MTKFTLLQDLKGNRTVYYNGGKVTMALGDPFSSANYRGVGVEVAPNKSHPDYSYSYDILACQVSCEQETITTTAQDINFTDVIRHDYNGDNRDYIRFPGFTTRHQVPGPFMLEGSSIEVSLVSPVELLDNATFVVALHLYTNVTECYLFYMTIPGELAIVLHLNQSNEFRTRYTTASDDFLCIVSETENGTVFNYSVLGTARQYRNLSDLVERGLCLESGRDAFHTGSEPTNGTVRLELSGSRFTRPQQTCVLAEISSASGAPATLDVFSTVYGTWQNIGVFSLSGVSILVFMFLVGGLLIFVCICVYGHYRRSGLNDVVYV